MSDNSTSGPYYVGIDLGGTNVKSGVVTDSGESLSYQSVPTDASAGPETGVHNIVRCAEAAVEASGLSWRDIQAIGLATPGTMDIPAGKLVDPPNLPGWNDLPIRELVAERFGIQTCLQNDGNAAAYGEYWIGAAKNARSMVLWTLGTGLGGGIIVGGRIIEGENSHGSECGHIIIEAEGGRLCPTGQYGTLEAYVSATALIARCREQLDDHPDSMLHQLLESDGDLTPILIAQAAESGDAFADELIMETARYLGIGTTTVMHCINPNMFLIGGAMTFGRDQTELGRRFVQRVRDEVAARAFPVPARHTKIEYATLGGKAGYIGAAGCARQEFGS